MAIHFDLTDLRLFAHIADANSLTRGAERTNLSLPSASNRIKNIEDALGIKLLHRTAQGVTLTPAGQTYLHHARQVLAQLERCRGDLQDYVNGLKGHVRIFANTNATAEFLPAILPRFLESHPDVNIDLREQLSDEIVRAVSEGKADVGIVAGSVRMEGLEVFPYREDRLVLVTPRAHPLAQRDVVAFEDTLAYDYVGLSDVSAVQIFLGQWAAKAHKTMNIRIQVGSFETICRMAENNVGIGVLPASIAQRHARTMAIRVIDLSDAWALRDLKICVRSLEQLPAFARDLVAMLAEDADSQRSP